MNTFQYQALEPSGRKRTGVVEAPDKETALAQLAANGTFVLEIGEKAGHKTHQQEHKKRGKVGRTEIAMFTRRLSDLSGAGLPLDRVLQVVAEQSESATLEQIALEALEDVRGGLPVSDALAKHPRLFPTVYTQTLKAGEASGQFSEVAARLADFQEKESHQRSQITSALVYPAILAVSAVGVIIFMLTFVVPKLAAVFKDLGGELPLNTRILLAMTDFLTSNGLWLLIAIVAGTIFYRNWIATDAGRLARDKMILRLPLAGPVIRKAVVSRYARVLGTLVYGGVTILEALRLAGLAAGNRLFETENSFVVDEVRDGRRIADAMRDTDAFPSVLTHMVAVGEETGDLPKMLGRVADSLDFEVEHGMQRIIAVLEPAIVLIMGGFVGFVVISVILPIYQAQDLVK